MFEFLPPSAPFEEEYWNALINDGEKGGPPAPPISPEMIWQGLRLSSTQEQKRFPEKLESHGWEEAIELMKDEVLLELPVVGYNRGGLLVDWNSQQGFVPASHLEDLGCYLDEDERENKLQEQVGCTLSLKIIEVDPERRRLVLSERATRSDENIRQAFLNELSSGEIRSGTVTNLRSFGAFVDLGKGVEGLVHISEISWGRVNHPSDVLQPGQEVEVYVLNVDCERGRVGLSVKRAKPDPWETLEEDFSVGDIVEGEITNVVDFGAFAKVKEGLEGLIHVSELAEGNFIHPRNVVQEGQRVKALVISMDGDRRRLGLSLRRLPTHEAANAPTFAEVDGSTKL